MKKLKRGILITACWLLLWQLCAMAVGSELLLPSPWHTLRSFCSMLRSAAFYASAGMTLLRVFFGFFLGVLIGALLGIVTAANEVADAFLSPLRQVLRSTPVGSFIVLALLYLSKTLTPMFTAMVMVTPIIWGSVRAGIRDTDRQLLEMAHVYRLSRRGTLRYIYLPSVLPQLLAASSNALGIAWKSGVAAEVIATPELSIGRSIYESKIYLETPSLFAWTAAVIMLSILMEKLILRSFDAIRGNRFANVRCERIEGDSQKTLEALRIEHVSLSYGEKSIFHDVSARMAPGDTLALLGASGSGKTTLLRVLAGLNKAQAGTVETGKCSYIFQEDRLLPWLTSLQNISLVCADETRARALLGDMELEEDAFEKLPEELSGGMRRRVAIARALACSGDTLLMDEPFTGIDEGCKNRIIARMRGRFAYQIIATHDVSEAEALGCTQKLVISAKKDA